MGLIEKSFEVSPSNKDYSFLEERGLIKPDRGTAVLKNIEPKSSKREEKQFKKEINFLSFVIGLERIKKEK